MRGLRSPSDKRPGAVPAGSPCALDGDVPVQTCPAESAAASGDVGDLVPAGNSHQPEFVCRGEGSMLHGSRNDSAHLRFCPSSRRAPCKSSEHPDRNFASRRSCLVLRLWQLRQSLRRLSGVNALSIAAQPRTLAICIASLWSISSDGSPHISQSVCCISSGCCPDATAIGEIG